MKEPMMKHDVTTTPDADTILADVSALYIHDANPRGHVTDAEIATLATSIARCGLLQNLCGIFDEEGERIGIVAGGRRMRAILLLSQEGRGVGPYPVKIAPDLETARAWANAENNARSNPHPADEIRGYGEMAAKGASVAEIAIANAVSEAHVRRRLKLADLPETVLTALGDNRISLKAAEIMTTAHDPERITAALAEMTEGNGFTERNLRRFLNPEAVNHTDRRVVFVGLDAYKAAGGTVTEDLFSEDVVLHDVATLDELFETKMEALCDATTAEGWKWVEASERTYMGWHDVQEGGYERIYPQEGELSDEEAEEYDALSDLANGNLIDEAGEARLDVLQAILDGDFTADQKAHSGIIVYVSQRGEVAWENGLICKEDKPAATEAGLIQKRTSTASTASGPKPPHSAKLQADLNAIRLAATQSSLVEKPETVLDLLAFALSDESGHYAPVMNVRLDPAANTPEDTACFEPDERIVNPRIVEGIEDGFDMPDSLASAFADFRAKGKKHRNAVIAARLARALNLGSDRYDLFEAVEAELSAGMRDVWTPTQDNFFKRVNGAYLNDIHCAVFDRDATEVESVAFAKLKKGEKAKWLHALFAGDETHAKLHGVTPEIRERIRRWVPTAD